MNKFEIVSKYIGDDSKVINDIKLPVRATKGSAGYDFFVIEDILIPSYSQRMEELSNYVAKRAPYSLQDIKNVTKETKIRPTLIPTGIKCHLDEGYYLELSIRSSIPLHSWLILANGEGIIDSDYYNNIDNEGEIFFQLINLAPIDVYLRKGDRVGQGIIKKYELVDEDIFTSEERNGGFGSTTNE